MTTNKKTSNKIFALLLVIAMLAGNIVMFPFVFAQNAVIEDLDMANLDSLPTLAEWGTDGTGDRWGVWLNSSNLPGGNSSGFYLDWRGKVKGTGNLGAGNLYSGIDPDTEEPYVNIHKDESIDPSKVFVVWNYNIVVRNADNAEAPIMSLEELRTAGVTEEQSRFTGNFRLRGSDATASLVSPNKQESWFSFNVNDAWNLQPGNNTIVIPMEDILKGDKDDTHDAGGFLYINGKILKNYSVDYQRDNKDLNWYDIQNLLSNISYKTELKTGRRIEVFSTAKIVYNDDIEIYDGKPKVIGGWYDFGVGDATGTSYQDLIQSGGKPKNPATAQDGWKIYKNSLDLTKQTGGYDPSKLYLRINFNPTGPTNDINLITIGLASLERQAENVYADTANPKPDERDKGTLTIANPVGGTGTGGALKWGERRFLKIPLEKAITGQGNDVVEVGTSYDNVAPTAAKVAYNKTEGTNDLWKMLSRLYLSCTQGSGGNLYLDSMQIEYEGELPKKDGTINKIAAWNNANQTIDSRTNWSTTDAANVNGTSDVVKNARNKELTFSNWNQFTAGVGDVNAQNQLDLTKYNPDDLYLRADITTTLYHQVVSNDDDTWLPDDEPATGIWKPITLTQLKALHSSANIKENDVYNNSRIRVRCPNYLIDGVLGDEHYYNFKINQTGLTTDGQVNELEIPLAGALRRERKFGGADAIQGGGLSNLGKYIDWTKLRELQFSTESLNDNLRLNGVAVKITVDNMSVCLRDHDGKKELQNVVKKAEALDKANYSDSLWASFRTALAEAKTTLREELPFASEIKSAQDKLEQAINDMVSMQVVTAFNVGDGTFNTNGHITFDWKGAAIKQGDITQYEEDRLFFTYKVDVSYTVIEKTDDAKPDVTDASVVENLNKCNWDYKFRDQADKQYNFDKNRLQDYVKYSKIGLNTFTIPMSVIKDSAWANGIDTGFDWETLNRFRFINYIGDYYEATGNGNYQGTKLAFTFTVSDVMIYYVPYTMKDMKDYYDWLKDEMKETDYKPASWAIFQDAMKGAKSFIDNASVVEESDVIKTEYKKLEAVCASLKTSYIKVKEFPIMTRKILSGGNMDNNSGTVAPPVDLTQYDPEKVFVKYDLKYSYEFFSDTLLMANNNSPGENPTGTALPATEETLNNFFTNGNYNNVVTFTGTSGDAHSATELIYHKGIMNKWKKMSIPLASRLSNSNAQWASIQRIDILLYLETLRQPIALGQVKLWGEFRDVAIVVYQSLTYQDVLDYYNYLTGGLDESDYTTASWGVMTGILQDAEAEEDAETLTDAKVNAYIEDLIVAFGNLELRTGSDEEWTVTIPTDTQDIDLTDENAQNIGAVSCERPDADNFSDKMISISAVSANGNKLALINSLGAPIDKDNIFASYTLDKTLWSFPASAYSTAEKVSEDIELTVTGTSNISHAGIYSDVLTFTVTYGDAS